MFNLSKIRKSSCAENMLSQIKDISMQRRLLSFAKACLAPFRMGETPWLRRRKQSDDLYKNAKRVSMFCASMADSVSSASEASSKSTNRILWNALSIFELCSDE